MHVYNNHPVPQIEACHSSLSQQSSSLLMSVSLNEFETTARSTLLILLGQPMVDIPYVSKQPHALYNSRQILYTVYTTQFTARLLKE